MEWLVIIGLVAAVVTLWRRVGLLEKQVRAAEPGASPSEPAVIRSMPAGAAEAVAAAGPSPPAMSEVPPIVPSWEPRTVPLDAADQPAGREAASDAAVGFLGRRPSFDFEDVFGRRLPIWAGGIALAVAGVFLVRFSIEAGLLTPQVRVALSFVFGLLLLGAAEAAFRLEDRVRDPRVRQALAGAGLATLYAGFYLAGTQYGLIGAGSAFVGLAAVTAAAIALSFRFGLPSAVLGLVGGFAAPALVASEEANVPLLTLYLALITAGLAFTGQRQGRPWLGYAALAGGFLWGLALVASGPTDTADLLALGLFLAAMGAVLPLLTGAGAGWHWVRLGAAALASLQLAALIELAGFAPLTWGLYLLLAAALAALAGREPRLREASAFAAALGAWLLLLWTAPPAGDFALVGAGYAAVFVLVPLAFLQLDRGRPLDLWQLSLGAPALAAATYLQFGKWDSAGPEPVLAAVFVALSLPPAIAAWREWRLVEPAPLLVVPIASAAALVFAALLMLAPGWAAPLAAAAVALALGALAWRRPREAVLNLAWAGALVVLAALAASPDAAAEGVLLIGIDDPQHWFGGPPDRWLAPLRWLAAGLPWLALARVEPRARPRAAAEALAALLAYGVAAQVVPADWLAWTAAAGGVLLWLALTRRRAGAIALLTVAALWALLPLADWTAASSAAAAGLPLLLDGVPPWREVLLRLVPLAAAAGIVAWHRPAAGRPALVAPALAAIAGLVALHSLYKHVFALATAEQFVRLGLAERTVWQALLVGAGLLAAWRAPGAWRRPAAIALLALGLAHFGWFGVLLHDPLWQPQHVGPWPLANLLLPAFAIAAVALVALRRLVAGPPWTGWAVDATLMAIIALFALSQLRQAFSGSLLTAQPMSQGEDLLRSLTGIVLAIGFLAWGARSGSRSWRVGSLVLMLLAVGKVFLVDAAGLEGLLRVASFMALGFSLIGIGWVYSRQLALRRPEPD